MSDLLERLRFWSRIAHETEVRRARTLLRHFWANNPQVDYSQDNQQNSSNYWHQQEGYGQCEWQQGYQQPEYDQQLGFPPVNNQSSWCPRDNYQPEWHSGNSYETCNQRSSRLWERSRGRSRTRYPGKYLWHRERPPLLPTPNITPLIEEDSQKKSEPEDSSKERSTDSRKNTTEPKEGFSKKEPSFDVHEKASEIKSQDSLVKEDRDSLKRESANKEELKVDSSQPTESFEKEVGFHDPVSREKKDGEEPSVETEMFSGREEKRPGKATVVSADQSPTVGSTEETSSVHQTPTTSDGVRTSKERLGKSAELTGERSPKSGDLKEYKIPRCQRPVRETYQKGHPRDQEKTTESNRKNASRPRLNEREFSEHRTQPAPDVRRVDTSTSKERRKTLFEGREENFPKRNIPEIKFRRDPREEVRKDAANAHPIASDAGGTGNKEHLKSLSVKDYRDGNVDFRQKSKEHLKSLSAKDHRDRDVENRDCRKRSVYVSKSDAPRVSSNAASPKEGLLKTDNTASQHFPKSPRARESFDWKEIAPGVLFLASEHSSKSSPADKSTSHKDSSKPSDSGQARGYKETSRDILVASKYTPRSSPTTETISQKSACKLPRFGESVSPKGNPRNVFVDPANPTSKSPFTKTPVTPIEVTKELPKIYSTPSPQSSPTCQVPNALADKLKNVPSNFEDFREQFYNEFLPAVPVDVQHVEDVKQFVEQLTCAISNGSPERCSTVGKAANPVTETGENVRLEAEQSIPSGLNRSYVRRGNGQLTCAISNGSPGRCTVGRASNPVTETEKNVRLETEQSSSAGLNRSDVRRGNGPVAYPPRQKTDTKEKRKSSKQLPGRENSKKSTKPKHTDLPLNQNDQEFETNLKKLLVSKSDTGTLPATITQAENFFNSRSQIASVLEDTPTPQVQSDIYSPSKPSSCKSPSPCASSTVVKAVEKQGTSSQVTKITTQTLENIATVPSACFQLQEIVGTEQLEVIVRGIVEDVFEQKMTSQSKWSSSKQSSRKLTHRRHTSDSTRRHHRDSTKKQTDKRKGKIRLESFVKKSYKHSSEIKKGSSNERKSESKRSRSPTASDSDIGVSQKKRRRIRVPLIESDEDEDAAPAKVTEMMETTECSVEEQRPVQSIFQTPTRTTDDIDIATPDSSARVSSCDRFSPWTTYDFDHFSPVVGSSTSTTDTASPVGASPAGSLVIPLANPSVIPLRKVQVDECNSTSVPMETVVYIDISDSEDDTNLEMTPEAKGFFPMLIKNPEEEPLESPAVVDDYPAVPSPAYSTASTSSMRTVRLDNQESKKEYCEVVCLSDDDDRDSWNALSELFKLKIQELSELYLVCYLSLQQFVTRVRESFNFTEAVRVAVEERSREELFKIFLPFCKDSEDKKKNLCKDFSETELFNFVDERLRLKQVPPGSIVGFAQMLVLLKQLNKRKTKKNWGRIDRLPERSDGLSVVEEVQLMLHLPFESDVRTPTVATAPSAPFLRASTESCPEVIPIITNVTSLDVKEEISGTSGYTCAMLYEGYSPDTTETDFEPEQSFNASQLGSNTPVHVEPEQNLATLKREGRECLVCGVQAEIRCSCCPDAYYCSRNCQTIHWKSVHQFYCKQKNT